MEEHIRKLHRLYQQLSAQGQLISDEDLTNMLLMSLLDTWSAFITTINTSGAPITSEMLITWILDEDHVKWAGSGWKMALKVQGKRPKGRQPGPTKGNCQSCSKKGHYVVDCWEKGSSKEGQVPKWFKAPKEKDTAKQTDK